MKRISGAVAAISILLAGILGTIVAALDLAGVDYHHIFNKAPEDIWVANLGINSHHIGDRAPGFQVGKFCIYHSID